MLDEDTFRKCLPDKMKKSIDQSVMDQINAMMADPDLAETYRDNLLSYTKVMNDGKFKLDSYVHAVKYISHKLMGCSNIEAYTKTFPDKIQRFTQQGVSSKDIASYVTAYNKSKLVNLVREQSSIAPWIYNQDIYQQAINAQAELMLTAKSEMVRSNAANSLLMHLKRPEAAKIELDVTAKEDSTIQALRDTTMALVAQQRLALQAGVMTAGQLAQSKLLIQGEAQEVNP